MRKAAILVALASGLVACEREAEQRTTASTSAPALVSPAGQPAGKSPSKVPRPKDQAQLDRMILAGYEPHDDHLHPPGVKSCSMASGPGDAM